jgi:hypothetical protein
MEFTDLERWTSYLSLHEEFQAGLRAYRLSNEALRARISKLEQEITELINFPPLQRYRSISRKLRQVLLKMSGLT